VQLDEKWSFVGCKEKHCRPEDARRGDCWDHTAFDPESRLVVSLVVGKRTAQAVLELVRDFHRRTGGRVMRLMTSDEYPAYADAIHATYGAAVVPERTGRPGRPRKAYTVLPPEVAYATVRKHRENDRVVRVSARVVFGTLAAVALALLASAVSWVVNTSFVERHNGTDRNRCSRKVRKTYGFSKAWGVHGAATRVSHFSYSLYWAVRSLRVRGEDGRRQRRTPAMAAGLADHVWTLREWATYPAVQRR